MLGSRASLSRSQVLSLSLSLPTHFPYSSSSLLCYYRLDRTYFAETKNIIAKLFLNVWIVPCNPLLMKKLLKSRIYGSVNSARMHCSHWKSQQMQLLFMNSVWIVATLLLETRKKKKKKKENAELQNANAIISIQPALKIRI